jgi:hypothetical protein
MEGSLVAYKVFTNGSVLNASEINDNLMRQSVMVFSNAAARTAAITSPVEGMTSYLEDTNFIDTYNGTAWVQTVSNGAWSTYTPTVTAALGSFTTVSATGRFKVIGKVVHVSQNILITINGTAAGSVRATLPFAQPGSNNSTSLYREIAVTGNMGQVRITDGLATYSTSANGYPGGTGYNLITLFTYEVA